MTEQNEFSISVGWHLFLYFWFLLSWPTFIILTTGFIFGTLSLQTN